MERTDEISPLFQTILTITAVFAALVLVPRSFLAGFFPVLPYPGPFEGGVLDRDTGQPIPEARIMCHWSCADLPIPHAPGEFHIYADTVSDAAGTYRIDKTIRRGGFSGCSFSISCKAKGYIEIVEIGDPEGLELPPSTQAWPFVETRTRRTIPAPLDFVMKPALPVLLQALESENDFYRQVAAEELGLIGSAAKPAFPALVSAAKDRSPEVRREAVEALGLVDPGEPSAISALAEALTDPDAETRERSVKALAQSGPEASSAVPALIAAMRDVEPMVRRRVPETLVAVGPGDRRVVPALVDALRDTDQRTRQEAGRALGLTMDETLPDLFEFLCAEDPEIRKALARILASRNQGEKLLDAIRDGDPSMRTAAIGHLGCLDREKQEFVPTLVELLADEDPGTSDAAAASLAEIGDPARPYLLEALKTEVPRMHAAVAEVLFSRTPHCSKPGSTPAKDLIQAIMRRPLSEAVSLICLGADVNGTGERGFTPLMAAAGRERIEILHLLLACGARIDAADEHGVTALMHAARAGNENCARILLDRGVNPDLRDMFDQTALVYAARSGSTGLMEILLKRETDEESRNGALYHAASDGRTESVGFLLDRGVSLEARNKEGDTPLMAAARFGQTITVKLLLDCGAEANARNRHGWTALMLAAGSGSVETLQLLIERGAAVDAKTFYDETALMFAAREGHREAVKKLLKAGAETKSRDRSGKTARDIATSHDHPEVAEMLR